MLTFWIIAAGLTLLALAFVILPLVKQHANVDVDSNSLNVAIYKERLAELEQEKLSPEQFALDKQELDKSLAQDLNEQTPAPAHASNCWASIVIAIFIPALAMGGYLTLGEPKFLMSPLAQFENDPEVLSDFADFLAKSNDNQFVGLPNTLLESALRIDPNHQKALWFSSMAAMEKGDYRVAIKYLGRLSAQMPPEAVEFKTILERQIAMAKQRLQGGRADIASPHATTSETKTESGDTMAKIEVHVSLAPALQEKVKPGDTLFIYATPMDSRMPLAVVKKLASELPTSATLDDSLAMMQTSKLSQFQEVTVWGRISRSGDAIPRSGDLQGKISPVVVNNAGSVEITIDRIVP
ncbi:MAG: c-type cytochrome biogenesis protein CcmI [Candidatus Parabeggiatoa sp. nov. 3]|nr:MAG: c-type cytochrome biogenesis protein CcmI [Gammaproteobacteria bacterium]